MVVAASGEYVDIRRAALPNLSQSDCRSILPVYPNL
jgi:hypothetical protein